MEILKWHLISVAIALVAVVYSDVLTEGGMILNWLYLKLESLLPVWIFKPLIGCYKCVAGQMALFGFTYLLWGDYSLSTIFLHVYFICLTIFLSEILCKTYRGNS